VPSMSKRTPKVMPSIPERRALENRGLRARLSARPLVCIYSLQRWTAFHALEIVK
jgi:hypothetical protein